MSLAESLSRGIEWFVPASLVEDAEARRRSRLLVAICATVLFWGPLYAALFQRAGLPGLALAAILCASAIALAPLVLRWSGSLALAGNLLAASLFVVVTSYSLAMGGLLTRGALWHPVFAIAGFAIAGRRSGLFWTSMAVAELIVFYGMEGAGWMPPPALPEAAALDIALASDVGLVLVVLTFTLVFESEKNHALDALRAANQQLALARDAAHAASETKSRFLANMSHEIRTPMNGVLGMSELLLQRPLEAEDRHRAGTIHRSARALLNLLNDILDLSKLEAGHVVIEEIPADPRQVVGDVVDLLSQTAQEKGLCLVHDLDPALPPIVRMDPLRVRQLLLNLVGNAIKFTEKGEVRVRVRALGPGRDLLFLHFEIQDTGIGIDAAALDTIFDSFTQADPSTTRRYGGTGLGLAICEQLVTQMGGELGVESERGEGATFWFRVPVQVAGEEPAAPQRSLTPLAGRVLLAEDNLVNRELASAMLEQLALQVVVVEDGVEALAAMDRETFDLVLTDCQMPRLDGYELARRIRELEREGPSRRMPVIALTAGATEQERKSCLEAGMDDHLAKPFDLNGLFQSLARWLPEGATTRDEPAG